MAIDQPNSKLGAGGGSGGSTDVSIQKGRNYVKEVIVELKKTTWPTKKESNRLTIVVISVIFVLGCYMGTLDYVLSYLVNRFSLIK